MRRLWEGCEPMRSGDAYVASLRDGRAVFLDGERVDDVTKHPAFVEPIRRVAETYDRAKAAERDPALTYADPVTGARHSNMWLPPRSAEDLGARPAHRHPEPFLHPGVVRETDAGIVVRGSHAIATSATMADWLFVSYITPLVPGDEDYAISLVMPMNAEGLRLYPRRPYATTATSVYDYPLSSRFDEVDTTVVFNDVLVPWEQVFIYRDVDLVNAQFHDSPSHTTANFQALVRFGVKLEFMAGLAMRLVEIQGATGDPSVQAMLGGEIGALCAAFDALVKAAEQFPLITSGVARPHPPD